PSATDATHDFHAMPGGRLVVDFIAHGLKGADHHRGCGPFPETQGWRPASGSHLVQQYLIQRHVLHGLQGARFNEFPVVIGPICADPSLIAVCCCHANALSIAVTTPATVMPHIMTSSSSTFWIAAVNSSAEACRGWPSSAWLMASSVSGGSMKKSPETCTC